MATMALHEKKNWTIFSLYSESMVPQNKILLNAHTHTIRIEIN